MSEDNSGIARKGALAESRIKMDPEVAAACDDLARLWDYGALAGVAEVIRERVRQVSQLGYTSEHDNGHAHGSLATRAVIQLNQVRASRRDGTADAAGDEEHLRKAGALVAAEIDRLHRAFSASETAEILADPATMDAIREGESDQR